LLHRHTVSREHLPRLAYLAQSVPIDHRAAIRLFSQRFLLDPRPTVDEPPRLRHQAQAMNTTRQATATLYQFALCPFCNKVRAALDLKGIGYRTVEVNPRNKKELPPLPPGAPAKVPVLIIDDETIADSTTILEQLAGRTDEGFDYLLKDDADAKRSAEIENWVDETFIQALPTVIYGTLKDAAQAARVVARESQFGPLQGLGVRFGGSLVMHMISKRILKKAGRKDGHAWVKENVDQFESWLGEQDFVVANTLSISDVAMHGALSCVRDFAVFEEVMARPRMRAWFERVQAVRETHRAN